jgi:cobyrinic acid a,c-diamide synthase
VATIHSSAKAFLVAGTRSGCGKTSVSLGLMAAMAEAGIRVQPYKAGPDFIDPGHHQAVIGVPSHNLDGWMLDPETVRNIFARHLHGSDVGIVEGAMGLFDGFSGTTEQGSAGQLAKILDIPVILVVDAGGMGRSAAAEVKGYVTFDPDITFAGIIFNNVASPRHEALLREAMAKNLDIPVLGCLPRNDALNVASRHLGLVMAHELDTEQRTRTMLQWINSAMNVREMITHLPAIALVPSRKTIPPKAARIRLGVAMDQAFCFYYRENLRALEQAGAELVFFSPMRDQDLPGPLHGLYLGGGYPELFARPLAANRSMRQAIKSFARAGHPIYAECGGFMYLMNGLQDRAGNRHEMVGIFDCECALQARFAALGYREVVTRAPSLLGPAGSRFRGHEFHYSRLLENGCPEEGIYATTDRKGAYPAGKGVVRYNTLGSYIHLHFCSNPELAPSFVRACAGEPIA